MKKSRKSGFGVVALFSLMVFIVLTITALIVMLVAFCLIQTGAIDFSEKYGPHLPILIMMVASVAVGTAVSFVMSHIILKPSKELINAIDRLSSGDFSVRLDVRSFHEIAELAESFNRMAQELDNTELLRSDFINSFSHEFKTPIVSIKGFAEMLKYDDLTEEERNDYLDIVIDESSRLASLATNVLNMSKVEKLEILSEKTRFNVGEQIRKCVILLQHKWEQKGLDVAIDGEDCEIAGNKELLSQIWLNLLENAIKFSPDGGAVAMNMYSHDDRFVFTIHNFGTPISEDGLHRVFDKFYQDDKSHASAGSGLGLALCKKIATLHNGSISVKSDAENGTEFKVIIPQE